LHWIVFIAFAFAWASTCRAQIPAVQDAIGTPTFVNIYWDPDWDAHSPGMTMNQIDNITSALVNSSYFSGLAEYGVSSVRIHPRSFRGHPACVAMAPATLNLWGNPSSITVFVDCIARHLESEAGGPPSGSTIYNVFLPPMTLEFDLAYHSCDRLPFAAGAYHNFAQGSDRGTPFTAIFANPACAGNFSGLIKNLGHEMVEAITDPYPGSNAVFGKEIADFCETLTGTPFLAGIPGGSVEVPFYWSASRIACISGFSDTSIPAINNVFRSGSGTATVLEVFGSGFGSLPAIRNFRGNESVAVQLPGHLPAFADTTLPYFSFQVVGMSAFSPLFSAGSSLLPDATTLRYSYWDGGTGRIRVEGFGAAPPGSFFVITVCNPISGQCSTASEPGLPSITSACSDLLTIPGSGCVSAAPSPGGSILTINGSGFGSSTRANVSIRGSAPGSREVILNGTAFGGEVLSSNSSRIRVRTPRYPPGPATITVTAFLGTSSASPETAQVSFTGFSFCAPRVDSVSPNGVALGQDFALTFTGFCFTGATRVTFGISGFVDISSGQMEVVNDTTIKVRSPLAGGIPMMRNVFTNCFSTHVGVESPSGTNSVAASPAREQDVVHFSYGICAEPRVLWALNARYLNICETSPHTCSPVAQLPKASLELPPYPLGPGRDIGKESPVSRAGFALALTRVFAFKEAPSIVFSDVEKGSVEEEVFRRIQPYLPAYRSKGEALEFQAGAPVERQEAAALAVRVLVASRKAKLPQNSARVDAVLGKLADSKQVSPMFRSYVAAAVSAGIMAPDKKQDFRPRAYLTREELALFLKNLGDRLASSR
jgi:hypothetical protein